MKSDLERALIDDVTRIGAERDHYIANFNIALETIGCLGTENKRLCSALEDVIESCDGWTNDDIRDHCRAALGKNA